MSTYVIFFAIAKRGHQLFCMSLS